jgi:hypothetical protein
MEVQLDGSCVHFLIRLSDFDFWSVEKRLAHGLFSPLAHRPACPASQESGPAGQFHHEPMNSMQGDARAIQSRVDIQELNFLAKHDDAAWLSIIASVTVLKSVGAFEHEVSIFVSSRFDICEGDSIVEELHLIHMTLSTGALHRDLVDMGTVEP